LIAILAYAAMPRAMKSGMFLDNRVLLFCAYLLFAPLVPKRPSPLIAASAGVLFGGLFLTRLLMLTVAWQQHDGDVAQFRDAIASVEPGSRVLVASAAKDLGQSFYGGLWRGRGYAAFADPADTHLGGLLIIDRRAFWPGLFAHPSQQPVTLLPPYSEISLDPVPGRLPAPMFLENASPELLAVYPNLENWRQRFDDVLIIGADEMPSLSTFLPDDLELLHTSGRVRLYRIRRSGT